MTLSKNDIYSCMITGVGGQGTVLLSRLTGSAAIAKGYSVRGTETIGMAQRGGSVVSHVRIGEEIFSPLIPEKGADLIIALEPAEAVRALPYLREGGALVALDRAMRPVSSALTGDYDARVMTHYLKEKIKNIIIADGDALIKECGSAKVVNVALLGAAVNNGLLPFDMADAQAALEARLPEKFLDMNIRALQTGARLERMGK